MSKRDARRDGFVQVIRKAMGERLGNDTEEVLQTLAKQGIKGQLAKRALEIARQQGGFSIFALVDALIAFDLLGFGSPSMTGLLKTVIDFAVTHDVSIVYGDFQPSPYSERRLLRGINLSKNPPMFAISLAA